MAQDYIINILAALNTFGIEYGGTCGFTCFNDEKPEVVINYRRKHFAEDAKKFLSDRPEEGGKGSWSHMTGHGYVQDGKDTYIIVLSRSYDHTSEELIAYAHWCGYETFEEAQCNYGDITGRYTYLGVRVKKSDLDNFVHEVAPYCW